MPTNPEVFAALKQLRKGPGLTRQKVRRSEVLMTLGADADAVYSAICAAVEKIEVDDLREAVKVAFAMNGDTKTTVEGRRNGAFEQTYVSRSRHIEREDHGLEEVTHLLTGDDAPVHSPTAPAAGPFDHLRIEEVTLLIPDDFDGDRQSDAAVKETARGGAALAGVVERLLPRLAQQDERLTLLETEHMADLRSTRRVLSLLLDLNQIVTVQNKHASGLVHLLKDKGIASGEELAAYVLPPAAFADLSSAIEAWAEEHDD